MKKESTHLCPRKDDSNFVYGESMEICIDERDRERQLKAKVRDAIPIRRCDVLMLHQVHEEEKEKEEKDDPHRIDYTALIVPFSLFVKSYVLPDFRDAKLSSPLRGIRSRQLLDAARMVPVRWNGQYGRFV